jgi:hypothetical protein
MSATSYRRGGRNLINDDASGTTSKTEPKTDRVRLRSTTDDEIRAAIVDDPDARSTDEAFWRKAHGVMPAPEGDCDDAIGCRPAYWFRSERGYQTRINAILRAYMNVQADDRSSVTITRTPAPSSAYKLFEQAMTTRMQILCTYNGRPRELCPIILGHSQGKEKALTYQFGGQSEKGLPPGGQWRCLWLAKVRNMCPRWTLACR